MTIPAADCRRNWALAVRTSQPVTVSLLGAERLVVTLTGRSGARPVPAGSRAKISDDQGVGVDDTTPAGGSGGEQGGSQPGAGRTGEFCTSCGAAVAGMRFCANCGAAIGAGARRHGDIEVGAVEPGGRVTVSRKGIITVTVIAVAVVGIAAAAWALVGRATEDTHTIKGDMTLIDSDRFRRYDVGDACSGSGGYGDIDEGTTVSVKDQKGTLIGSGRLGPGKIEGSVLKTCVFPFEVTGVKDAQFFQVEVSRRGGLSYSKSEMEKNGWTVHASLGG